MAHFYEQDSLASRLERQYQEIDYFQEIAKSPGNSSTHLNEHGRQYQEIDYFQEIAKSPGNSSTHLNEHGRLTHFSPMSHFYSP